IGFSHLRDLCQFVHQLVHQLFERGLEIVTWVRASYQSFTLPLYQRGMIFYRLSAHSSSQGRTGRRRAKRKATERTSLAGVASATPAKEASRYLTEGHNSAGNYGQKVWKSRLAKGFSLTHG